MIRARIIATAGFLAFVVSMSVVLVRPQSANAARFCDTFSEPGLLTEVQVYANRFIGCDRAIR